MGITSWAPDSGKHFGLSLTLGGAETRPIDMAQLYATLANNGLKIPLVAITRVVDAEGNVLVDYKVPQGEQVIDPRAAYMTTHILQDPAAKLFTYGPNTPLVLRQGEDPRGPVWPTASKTGTTDNYRDTWTNGYTTDLVIAVWVGNADGRPMKQTLSTMTAARIWPASMKLSFEYFGLQPQEFPRPDGIVERQVCGDTRMRVGAPACWNDLFFAENAPRGTVNAGAVPPARPSASPTPGGDAPAAPTVAVPPAAPKPQAKPTQAPAQQAAPTVAPAQPKPEAKPTVAPAAPAPTAASQPKPQPKPTQAPAQPKPKP
jgi:membrane peptidoglycan carboxypeptidase